MEQDQCRLHIFITYIDILCFDTNLKTLEQLEPEEEDVPDHHEGEPEEQAQGSTDLSQEGFKRIDENFLQNLHTVGGEGKTNERKAVIMCLAIVKVLKVWK